MNTVLHPNRWLYRKRKFTKAQLRREAIAGFYERCQYCEGEGDSKNGPDGRPWHLDRWIPGAQGGEYEPDNVVLSCATCNIRKKDREPWERPEWDAVVPLGARFHMTHCATFLNEPFKWIE